MAITQDITIYLAADYTLQFSVTNADKTLAIDLSTMQLSWMLKRSLALPDSAALIEKNTGAGSITVSGVFNANPTINTQVALITVTQADTVNLQPTVQGQPCFHELKRMNTNLEAPLTVGAAILVRGVHKT